MTLAFWLPEGGNITRWLWRGRCWILRGRLRFGLGRNPMAKTMVSLAVKGQSCGFWSSSKLHRTRRASHPDLFGGNIFNFKTWPTFQKDLSQLDFYRWDGRNPCSSQMSPLLEPDQLRWVVCTYGADNFSSFSATRSCVFTYNGRTNFILPMLPKSSAVGLYTVSSFALKATW